MNPSLEWTIATLTSLSQMGYTGKLELNFSLGGVTGVNLNQNLKPMTEIKINVIGREVMLQNT